MSLASTSEFKSFNETTTLTRSGSTEMGTYSPKSLPRKSVRKTLTRVSSLLFKTDRDPIKRQNKKMANVLVSLPISVVTLIDKINNSQKPLTKLIDKIYKEDYIPEDIETNQTNIDCSHLVKLLENEQIYLFDEISNITSVLSQSKTKLLRSARILCNGMEVSHFHLLEVMIKVLLPISETVLCDAFISRFALLDDPGKMLHLKLFYETISQNYEIIFVKEKYDPYYIDGVSSREITAASDETMFDLIFDNNYHEEQYMRNFIYFLPYVMKHRDVYATIMNYYNIFNQEHPEDDEMKAFLSWKYVRLERLVLSWLDIMATMICEVEPEFFKELNSSPLLQSEQLTVIFKNKFLNFLKNYDHKHDENTEVEVAPYMKSVARDVLFSIVTEETRDEQQIKILLETFTIDPIYSKDQKTKVVNLIQLNPVFLAEQLVLFDLTEFQKIHCHDFYLSRKNNTLETYIKSCQKIEFLALKVMDILKNHKICEYFIKVANSCYEMKGYNTCYLIYSTLTTISIKHPDVWSKVKKSKLQIYKKLQILFEIGNNYKNYRSISTDKEGIPIMTIWMHDIVNINCIPNKIDELGLFNFSKLRAIGSIITLLHSLQKIQFNFKPYDIVQRVINNIIVPDSK
ncbi:RasGEF domain containing protein [Entamoeba histolytica HM-3:IMSS]|uniref:Ras-GEF domain-containing protein n=5 Tax=Entamoeba histolytica TaxID=5759 RepID=C4M3I5_ENTH1|nr:hypothetical protein EHI_138430 [Entamoeba histolytica HM-1:IMSS]EAL49738.1 hypothetical protein EHI_138430 [Entamoeba histolytica HM-1:IMSS]EMS16458.1 RasGEF domain containing protein [Entamoeba histolytica HM-3:IMSS]ENY60206.1 RasGEF domain containing protein [Entamoeba histolytica HM-1:IMSS-A]GAT95883.1 hypothetical protein CL6EHI_138430 [Entamoeba histolytica]|eukprot:XP_655125.1 hypothetical protein EHI_138430 [Entamoeba histolytica HM-1:IMSS]